MTDQYVEVVNGPEFEAKLNGIARRALDPVPALAVVAQGIEAQERVLFGSYGGKYVQTGALEASLTGPAASGAIRELTPGGLAFGTDIPYARFQGTTGPGNHAPPSAILRLSPEDKAAAPKLILEYVVHGTGA